MTSNDKVETSDWQELVRRKQLERDPQKVIDMLDVLLAQMYPKKKGTPAPVQPVRLPNFDALG